MNKEYITKLNEMVDELYTEHSDKTVQALSKLNRIRGYLSALETLIK